MQGRSQLALGILAVASAALLTSLGRLFGAGPVDDTYIFLRYADNLARGVGPVFNAGERVEGFSSPLWTLLLAGVRLLTPRLEFAALFLSVASALGVSALVWHMCRGADAAGRSTTGLVLPLGLVCLPATVYWAFSGMDQSLFTLLVTATLVSSLADNPRQVISPRTTTLLILALLARSEGVLLAGWVALCATVHHGRFDAHWRRRIVAPVTAVAAVLALQLAARYAYYGVLVPHTYYAKVTPDTWTRLAAGGVYLGRCLIAHAPILALAAVTYRLSAAHGRAPRPAGVLLGGWIVLWSASVLHVGGDHFAMYRFFLPALPAALILTGICWQSVRPVLGLTARRLFPAVIAVTMLVSSTNSMLLDGRRARLEPHLAGRWKLCGQWIAAHTPPDTVVATSVIGAIGYFSNRRLIDMAGITDAVVGRTGALHPGARPGHARYHTDYVYSRAPDLIVYPSSGAVRPPFTALDDISPAWYFALLDFLRDPRCAQRYEHIAVELPNGTWLEMQKQRTFSLPTHYLSAGHD